MRECKRCGVSEENAPIHEHHINGNHYDDRLENKMLLCSNCHMMLHWKRWTLSDVGMEDVEIVSLRYGFNKKIPQKAILQKEIDEIKIEKEGLLIGIEYYTKKMKLDREINDIKIKEFYKVIMELRFPYEVRERFIKIEKELSLYKFTEQQELNSLYFDYLHSCRFLDEIKELEEP
jgi:hypothetical protein